MGEAESVVPADVAGEVCLRSRKLGCRSLGISHRNCRADDGRLGDVGKPALVSGGEIRDRIGILRGDVASLARVVLHVIELPVLPLTDRAPTLCANGLAQCVEVLDDRLRETQHTSPTGRTGEEHPVGPIVGLTGQQRRQTHAVQR